MVDRPSKCRIHLWVQLTMIILLLFEQVKANIDSNPYRLQALFAADTKLASMLQDLQDLIGQANAPKALNLFLESHNFVTQDIKNTVMNSEMGNVSNVMQDFNEKYMITDVIHIYLLMRRMVEHLEGVLKFLEKEQHIYDAILSELKAIKNSIHWPLPRDLAQSMLYILRVQYAYKLSTMDIASGILGLRRTSARLSAEECLSIARSRVETNRTMWVLSSFQPEFALAIEWAETALILAAKTYGREADFTTHVRNFLIDLQIQHDCNFVGPTPGDGPSLYPNEAFFIAEIGLNLEAAMGRRLRLLEYERFKKRLAGEYILPEEMIAAKVRMELSMSRDFFALCRGEQILEVVQSRPLETYIIHDAVHDDHIERIKSSVKKNDKWERGNVNPKLNMMTLRTQIVSWLDDNRYPELHQLSRHLDHLSRLEVACHYSPNMYRLYYYIESEFYQVGLYNPGGMYFVHKDHNTALHYEEHKENWVAQMYRGGRLATLMLYLNDVEEGGRTAFPRAGFSVQPSKGSILLWYNLYSDGSFNPYSYHGGCPVMYGIKWVSNKWIRESSQFRSRPCRTSPEDEK